jgi:hypothetical protein
MVGSQIGTLTLDLYFNHNLCFKYSNGSCEPILNIYISRIFQWYKELFNPMSFDPLKLLSEDSRIHQDFNSPSGNPLGNVWVHSLTLSYTLGSMKCDSQASFLACTFASLCFGCEPKAKVAIKNICKLTIHLVYNL